MERVEEGLRAFGNDLRKSSKTGRGLCGLQGSLRTRKGRGRGLPFLLPPPGPPPHRGGWAGQAPQEEAVSLAPCPPVQQGRAGCLGAGLCLVL